MTNKICITNPWSGANVRMTPEEAAEKFDADAVANLLTSEEIDAIAERDPASPEEFFAIAAEVLGSERLGIVTFGG